MNPKGLPQSTQRSQRVIEGVSSPEADMLLSVLSVISVVSLLLP